MSQALKSLTEQLYLEPLDNDVFLGRSIDLLGSGRIFGGQVVGQSIMAASRTVSDQAREAHSLHAYFLRPGDTNEPIRFEVERIRDGGSFSARRVVAIQHERPIFFMSASFQAQEPGYEHQATMPANLPAPEDLHNEMDLAQLVADKLPGSLRHRLQQEQAIDIRPVLPMNILKPGIYPARSHMWFKANGTLPDNPLIHKSMLAYTSDFYLLFASLLPHQQSPFSQSLQAASIDHAIWFHRPVNMNDWLLYDIESPNAGNARGFSRANVFDRQGRLVASTAQEGLIRVRQES